jgi:hypothetical protein
MTLVSVTLVSATFVSVTLVSVTLVSATLVSALFRLFGSWFHNSLVMVMNIICVLLNYIFIF